MAKTRDELIQELLANPSRLKTKKPFTRGAERNDRVSARSRTSGIGEKLEVCAPRYRGYVVPQEQYLRELDPY